MVTHEGAPPRGGRSASLDHILRDAGLSDLKAELEQLAVDARRSPQRIVRAHPPDQHAQLCIDLRPASQGARFPAPVAAKTGTMPEHKSLGPDDRYGLEHGRKPAIQLEEEQTIAVRRLDATEHLALQHGVLMPERRILGFKSAV